MSRIIAVHENCGADPDNSFLLDLEKLAQDNPYRKAVEKALDPVEMQIGEIDTELMWSYGNESLDVAIVQPPAMVLGCVTLYGGGG